MSILRRRLSSLPGADLGSDFWWIFASSTCLCLVSGASAPLLARYAIDDLGASAGVVGLLVGSSSIAAIALRPLLGALADRFGLRRASVLGSVTLVFGVVVLMLAHSVAPGVVGRMISGLSTAAANTALMAWVIGLVPLEQRGRALGMFGVSIWVGLAVGPQIGQTLVSTGGYSALWIGCGVLGLAAAACVLRARPPRIEVIAAGPPHRPFHLLRLVARPGAASAIAWAGEGLILTFLVIHLEGRGIPAGGLTGAASVFTVFAISVIGGRIASASLVDRVGAVRTAAVALLMVGAGLGTLAVAASFAVAALGGVLLGFGFAPLFPALALLATERLRPEERGSGVGIFSAFMDAGIASGSVLGGVLVATIGSGAAIGVVAVAQLVAVALVLGTSPHRSSNPAGLATSILSTEASETPPL